MVDLTPVSDPDMLRETLRQRGMLEQSQLGDEALQLVADRAKRWVCGRRWSWTVVASNYLKDGYCHASSTPWRVGGS